MTQPAPHLSFDEARRVIDMLLAGEVPPGGEFIWLQPDEMDIEAGTQARPGLNEANIEEMFRLMGREDGWNWQGMRDWIIVFYDASRVALGLKPHILAHGFHRHGGASRACVPMYVLRVPGTVEMAQWYAAAANRETDIQAKRDDQTRDNAIRMALFNPLCRGLTWRAIARHVGGKVDHKTVKAHYDRYVAAGELEPWDTDVVRTADGRAMNVAGIRHANTARAEDAAAPAAPSAAIQAAAERARIVDLVPQDRNALYLRLQAEGWWRQTAKDSADAIVVTHRELGELSLVFVAEADALIQSTRERRLGVLATAPGQMVNILAGGQRIERRSLGGEGPLVIHEAVASGVGAYTLTCLSIDMPLCHSDDLELLRRIMADLSTPPAVWMVAQREDLSEDTRGHYQKVLKPHISAGTVWPGRKPVEAPEASLTPASDVTAAAAAGVSPGAVEEPSVMAGAAEGAGLTIARISAASLGLDDRQALLLGGYQLHADALREVSEHGHLSAAAAQRVLDILSQTLRLLEGIDSGATQARPAA